MATDENPAPRANAEGRANSKIKRGHDGGSAHAGKVCAPRRLVQAALASPAKAIENRA